MGIGAIIGFCTGASLFALANSLGPGSWAISSWIITFLSVPLLPIIYALVQIGAALSWNVESIAICGGAVAVRMSPFVMALIGGLLGAVWHDGRRRSIAIGAIIGFFASTRLTTSTGPLITYTISSLRTMLALRVIIELVSPFICALIGGLLGAVWHRRHSQR
jgi:hypothetical protein